MKRLASCKTGFSLMFPLLLSSSIINFAAVISAVEMTKNVITLTEINKFQ